MAARRALRITQRDILDFCRDPTTRSANGRTVLARVRGAAIGEELGGIHPAVPSRPRGAPTTRDRSRDRIDGPYSPWQRPDVLREIILVADHTAYHVAELVVWCAGCLGSGSREGGTEEGRRTTTRRTRLTVMITILPYLCGNHMARAPEDDHLSRRGRLPPAQGDCPMPRRRSPRRLVRAGSHRVQPPANRPRRAPREHRRRRQRTPANARERSGEPAGSAGAGAE